MKVTFHGAAGTVTGSRFLVEAGSTRVLIDCGLFQGLKAIRERNWKELPFDPGGLDGVVLTHAHIDHTGFLPVLVREGYAGRIHATPPTVDLCAILLRDSAHLQEEDAAYANRKKFSRHKPARPLYTQKEAERAAGQLVPVERELTIGEIELRFVPAGHILGASSIELRHDGKRLLFSGDLGRSDDPLMPAPTPPGRPDWIVMESTYGNRRHPDFDAIEALGEVLKKTLARKGVLLIPAFAVGRAQLMLYCIDQAFRRGFAPRAPVFLDSPMASDVTTLYRQYPDSHRLGAAECASFCGEASIARSVEESKAIDRSGGPKVIVSASGMLSGGRVLHHLKAFAGDRRNTILLAGFQASGTRGAQLLGGADEIKIHGSYVDVRAEVRRIDAFSAHAGQRELLDWVGACEAPPQRVFLVHGEPDAADELRRRIRDRHGFPVRVPQYGETVDLSR